MSHFFIFIASLIGLLLSSNFVLECSEKIGKKIGMSPLAIGIFFIGFGTSLPELIVSHIACFDGKQAISLGNILGSNISNTALILSVACFLNVIPLKGETQFKQMVFHILVTFLVAGFYYLYQGFDALTGVSLLVLFAFYMWQIVFKDKSNLEIETEDNSENMLKNSLVLIVALVLMFFSGKYLVSSISSLGSALGISDYIISAVVLAFGTSAPELFTTIIATIKKKDVNLILGNILGSNVFNLCLVLGTTAFHKYSLVGLNLDFEIGVLAIMSVYILVMSFAKGYLAKKSGLVLLMMYGFSIYHWLS